MHFLEHCDRLAQVFQYGVREYGIEFTVSEGQFIDVFTFEANVIHFATLSQRLGLLNGLLSIVNGDHLSRRNYLGQTYRDGTGTTAAIQEPCARTQMGEEELRAIVRRQVEESGASGPQAFGQVMKAVMAEVGSKADGKTVSAIVREILS